MQETGRWYCVVACEVPLRDQPLRPGVAGVHLGIVNNVTVYEGEESEAEQIQFLTERYRKAAERRIKKAQRKLARQQRQSKRRKKTRAELAEAHAKLAAARRGRQHEIAARIVRRCGTVAVEALQVKRMTRSAAGTIAKPGDGVAWKRARARDLLAVAPHQFRMLLEQKAARSGGRVDLLSPAWNSSTCLECGHVDPRSRRGATKFTCTSCGHRQDADIGAAGTNSHSRRLGAIAGPHETPDTVISDRRARERRRRQNSTVRALLPRSGVLISTDRKGEKERALNDVASDRLRSPSK